MTAAVVSTLPLADAFQAEYLEANGILPLELVDGKLRVAVHGDS